MRALLPKASYAIGEQGPRFVTEREERIFFLEQLYKECYAGDGGAEPHRIMGTP